MRRIPIRPSQAQAKTESASSPHQNGILSLLAPVRRVCRLRRSYPYILFISLFLSIRKVIEETFTTCTHCAPNARVHDLRHTFAVNSLQCGDDVKTVQGALGHATAAFTLDVYGYVSERMMEEHANRQQAYIKSLGL